MDLPGTVAHWQACTARRQSVPAESGAAGVTVTLARRRPQGSIVCAVARYFARLSDPVHVAAWVRDLIFIMSTPEHRECAAFEGGCEVCAPRPCRGPAAGLVLVYICAASHGGAAPPGPGGSHF